MNSSRTSEGPNRAKNKNRMTWRPTGVAGMRAFELSPKTLAASKQYYNTIFFYVQCASRSKFLINQNQNNVKLWLFLACPSPA
jgi:hypothetical protein